MPLDNRFGVVFFTHIRLLYFFSLSEHYNIAVPLVCRCLGYL